MSEPDASVIKSNHKMKSKLTQKQTLTCLGNTIPEYRMSTEGVQYWYVGYTHFPCIWRQIYIHIHTHMHTYTCWASGTQCLFGWNLNLSVPQGHSQAGVGAYTHAQSHSDSENNWTPGPGCAALSDSQELSHTLQDESDPRAEGGTPVPWEGPLSVENPLVKHSVTVTKL